MGSPTTPRSARTREIIEICHSVWRRETASSTEGAITRCRCAEGRGTGLGKPLKIIDHPVRERIPIFVASLGPKNVEMTAELTEGWLPLHFWPDRAEQVWGPSLDAGLAKRAADLAPLEIVAGGPLAIGDDVDELSEGARAHARPLLRGHGGRGKNFYNDVLRRYGYEKEAERDPGRLSRGRPQAAAALVPDELVEGMSLVGDAGFVKDRVAAYRESGVTVLNVQPIGPNGLPDIETIADWVA